MGTIALTGARGFIGKNLAVRLAEAGHSVVPLPHDLTLDELAEKLAVADFIVHLAGVNRPESDADYETGNVEISRKLVKALLRLSKPIPLVYSSSAQAELDNAYGRSKRAAEQILDEYGASTGAPVHIWRLPNVFGKWCRPNYNSVVATFSHNIARGLPITINDASTQLRLVYVDDVVDAMLSLIATQGVDTVEVGPIYEITLGELAGSLQHFRDSRRSLMTGPVGSGLQRALHATFLSYLQPTDFAYDLVAHTDPRGTFVEMLRTPDAGQFSFFTAHPGITRGGHYHHSKTEKFLVLQGQARFGFRNILTDETFVLEIDGATPRVVETVPGWSHDITNIGDETMIVMLWANEVFNSDRPDTVAAKVLLQ